MHKHALLFLCAVVVGAGCRCKRDEEGVRRPQDDANVAVHDAPAPQKPSPGRFVFVRDDVVDLERRAVTPKYFIQAPTLWESDARYVYFVDKEKVAAIEPDPPGVLWQTAISPAVGEAVGIASTDAAIIGVWENNVARFDRSNGKRTLLLPGAGAKFVQAKVLGDALLVMDAAGVVTIVDLETATVRYTSTASLTPASALELVAFPSIGAEIGLICRAPRGGAGDIDCFGAHGPATVTHYAIATSCAYLRGASDHHLLYSGSWTPCGTWAVRVDDPSSSFTSTDDVAALLEHDDGTLEGALAFTKTTSDPLRLLDAGGATKWSATLGGSGESLALAARGSTLFLARYDRIATGSSLVALDRSTGKILWTGAVEQLSIPHSKYSNVVTLSLRGEDVVMVGVEAGGSYVQLFDASTGARRFSHLVK